MSNSCNCNMYLELVYWCTNCLAHSVALLGQKHTLHSVWKSISEQSKTLQSGLVFYKLLFEWVWFFEWDTQMQKTVHSDMQMLIHVDSIVSHTCIEDIACFVFLQFIYMHTLNVCMFEQKKAYPDLLSQFARHNIKFAMFPSPRIKKWSKRYRKHR